MPPRRRTQFTQEHIDQQLQQIHLLDPASSSENLEQLGPIIRQIHANRQQEAYLRTVQALIDSKDAEIEKICSENYQDFISSVSTLFTVKSYTDKMKESIASLDDSVAKIGGGLVEKKRALLQTKKTAANMDEAIDTLQACLRVLDVVDRVGEMVKAGRYWSALRSLEDIQNMPSTSLSQTAFFQHLLSSLPSLRSQIKDAVTASMKQWLLEIRNNSTEVGRLAVESMETRTRRWRSKREKDPLLRMSRVGSAVELITYEKTEFNVLNNEKLQVDFKPLFECIHIYTSLDSLNDLQRSYQADRKACRGCVLPPLVHSQADCQAQSDLILPTPLRLASLPALTQEISGFFIVESHVLETTGTFRSQKDVEELWDALVGRLSSAIEEALHREQDPEAFLRVKESLLSFIMTLESLDNLLIKHISEAVGQRLVGTSTLTQIAQIITNLEHFQAACAELQRSLTNLRSSQRGGIIRLNATSSFQTTLSRSLGRIAGLISSKLDQFFELSEYDWTPKSRETSPSMYLYELVNWLTTVVDSLVIKESYKDEAYKGALTYIADCLMNFLGGRDIPMLNENAISNILIDVDFLEDELKRIGRGHLASVFTELRLTASIPLNNTVQEYLVSGNRQSSYAVVKAKRLQALLDKLAKYGSQLRDAASREQAEKRRKEADAVGRIFPGENR
ncbi:hypothetical protein MD484_g4020, partial [Candolleomyces efflorescens]